MTLGLLAILFATGLVAGFVDSIAGGGGLITIPVLLNLGLPPQLALGTNKLQATFGSTSAMWHYHRAGLIDFKACRPGIVCTFVAATLGSLLVNRLPPDLLRHSIPWLLIAIALYLLVQPKLGELINLSGFLKQSCLGSFRKISGRFSRHFGAFAPMMRPLRNAGANRRG